MTQVRHIGNATLYQGDALAVLAGLADDSVDAVVTDPPYHLTTGKKGGTGPASVDLSTPQGRARIGVGFMGLAWDGGDIAQNVDLWRQALRVLKPGGHMLAFGGSRTYHRMACAIEDAGFEIRDQIMWVYGSGFPKSLDVSQAIDKRRDWTALPLLQLKVRAAREALGISQSEAARRMGLIGPDDSLGGGGFMWFETGRRVPTRDQYPALKAALGLDGECDATFEAAEREVLGQGFRVRGKSTVQLAGLSAGAFDITAPGTEAAAQWQGWGTALKPAHEPIVLARKPLAGTVAANVVKHGTGGLNIDGCRVTYQGDADKDAAKPQGTATSRVSGLAGKVEHDDAGRAPFDFVQGAGRWPANLIHDGSDEVTALFPRDAGASAPVRGTEPSMASAGTVTGERDRVRGAFHADAGSAARFFYTAKASPEDRHEGIAGTALAHGRNHHATVKPLDLMRYLCRLVTPPGGTVADMFMGSGSTGKAALLEGFAFIGVELLGDHFDMACSRIEHAWRQGFQFDLLSDDDQAHTDGPGRATA